MQLKLLDLLILVGVVLVAVNIALYCEACAHRAGRSTHRLGGAVNRLLSKLRF